MWQWESLKVCFWDRERWKKCSFYVRKNLCAYIWESGNRLCLLKLWKQSSCFKLYRLNFTVIISHETKWSSSGMIQSTNKTMVGERQSTLMNFIFVKIYIFKKIENCKLFLRQKWIWKNKKSLLSTFRQENHKNLLTKHVSHI